MMTKPFRIVGARWQPGPVLTFALMMLAATIGTTLGVILAVWTIALYFGVILL